jgi:D-threo-aldose 1-dehydrogenase
MGEAQRGKERDGLVLSTKVGRLLRPGIRRPRSVRGGSHSHRYDYSFDGVMRSLEESLQRLGRWRVDILREHDGAPPAVAQPQIPIPPAPLMSVS